MNQRGLVKHVESAALRPIIQLLPIHALFVDLEVWNWERGVRFPMIRRERNVTHTHYGFTEAVDTML